MKLSASLEAVAALVVGLLTVLLVILVTGCSSAPPEIRAGGLAGTLVLESPAGPVTVDLGAGVVVGDAEGWRVAGYEAQAYVVVDYQGIAHRVEVDATGRCVVAHYHGLVVLDWQVPGTACGVTDEVDKPPQGGAHPDSSTFSTP